MMPNDADAEWIPSLEPIFRDFIERIRQADRAAGGTGGPKGGWMTWLPWWVNEQRSMGAIDFSNISWEGVMRTMRDREEKGGIYRIDWDRKVSWHMKWFMSQHASL